MEPAARDESPRLKKWVRSVQSPIFAEPNFYHGLPA